MIFSGPAPRWFSIPADRPFLDDLAAGLLRALSDLGPEALSDTVVLTPTRRGARSLAEAFVGAAGGRAVLLPQIRALGDLDEGEPPFEPGDIALDLPPAISPLRRRFELARLVLEHADRIPRRTIDADAALELADALAGLLDSAQIEEAAPGARLDALVSDELAQHWQVSADFLHVALTAWPERLATLGLTDVSERRTKLLRILAEQWRERPPDRPLIAAGSTGTAPATAALLGVIAAAPQGAVVLPGLDTHLAESAWDKVIDGHPQATMKRLLAQAGVSRAAVRDWPLPAGVVRAMRLRWRERLINEALRPAEATDDWRRQIEILRAEGEPDSVDPVAAGLEGLCVLKAKNEDEAAAAIALLLRETLETPGRTAALVTPDQDLARRVSARLRRWGIEADASAGTPLAGFPVAVQMANLARAGAQPLDPARTLALLKHPLTRLGLAFGTRASARGQLERYGFRGPRRESWAKVFEQLQDRIAREAGADAPDAGRIERLEAGEALGERLRSALQIAAAPFAGGSAEVAEAARALSVALERLAEDEAGRPKGLWAGPQGEAAAGLLAALISEGGALPPVTPAAFADIIDHLLETETVRDAGQAHPRLRILGAIEARMVRADRLVLAGLEEGTWPRAPALDPFLSRPMREALGLPPPERRLGLSAHDFAQAACAPEVVLVHMQRRGGQPAVESRWLWRLRTLALGADIRRLPGRPEVLDWARALDAPLAGAPLSLKPAPRPNPAPPVEVRPITLPVTGVERWVRDPYALYARLILRLKALERPDEPVEARLRGTAVHEAFERFVQAHPEVLPDDAEAVFRILLVEELRGAGMPEPRMAREQALAANLAPWVVEFERTRRNGATLAVEKSGSTTLDIDGAPFTLTAKADRLELRARHADILDFKTGRPPSDKEVKAGFAPQLTLTAAILARGGFDDAGGRAPGELLYVRVNGTRTQGDPTRVAGREESGALAEAALDGLIRRVRAYRDPVRGYQSRVAPQFVHAAGDYDHLARVFEWHVMGEEDEGAPAP